MSSQPVEETTSSPKVNFWEESQKKRRELQVAAKAKAEAVRSATVPATSARPPVRAVPARDLTPPPVCAVPALRTRPAPTLVAS
ncbi:hypothetical protein TNCV_921541 [Trichonephila clavipes]|nr:hypothetical protein TNCV_921541 [Trichonephila clavipes]